MKYSLWEIYFWMIDKTSHRFVVFFIPCINTGCKLTKQYNQQTWMQTTKEKNVIYT